MDHSYTDSFKKIALLEGVQAVNTNKLGKRKKIFIYTIFIINIFAGAFTVIFYNLQDETTYLYNGQEIEFDHPFIQALTMDIGDMMSLFIFLGYIRFYRVQYEKEQKEEVDKGKIIKLNYFKMAIPTIFDCLTSTLAFFALGLLPSSIYSMLRGGNVIVTAFFSWFFLKEKLHRHHFFGMFLLISGLIIVGLSVFVGPGDSSSLQTNQIFLGMILLVLAFFTFSTQITVEQKFFHQYSLNPFQLVGLEGVWGIIFSTILVVIGSFIPCPKIKGLCSNKNLEDPAGFVQQVFHFNKSNDQPEIFLYIIFGIFTVLIFNVTQVSITKYVSSLTRNVMQLTYPVIVWIFSIIIGQEDFSYIQLIGFIVVSFGSLLYNEIIVLPWFGFNKYIQKDDLDRSEIIIDNETNLVKRKDRTRVTRLLSNSSILM